MSSGARWAAGIGAVVFALLTITPSAQARLRWSDCRDVDGARCAMLSVPLDQSGAVAGRERLRLARFNATRKRPTLLYLSGGPGGAGVRELSDVLYEVDALPRRYNVVGYDQRGTGYSGLLRCPELERDPRLRASDPAGRCAQRLGRRRAFYTTADSVADIEAIRQELGVEKLTLLGISYGTKLALVYARAHPDRVERMALDSVLDPDDADAFGLEPYRAMGPTLASLCPRRCAGVSTDPAGDLSRLVAKLGAAPLRGTYRTTRSRRRSATLTSLALSDLMFDADYNPTIRAGIPAAVRAALDHDDATPLLRLIQSAKSLSQVPDARLFSAGRYATVCEETPLPWGRDAPFDQRQAIAQERAAQIGPQAFFPFDYATARADEIDLCLRWPGVPRPEAGQSAGVYPPVPTLILQGGEDLRTPPEGSARVAAALPKAQRVVVAGVGHAVIGGDPTRCGIRRLYAFLRARRASAPCPRVATQVPATGVPPSALSQLAPVRGVPGNAGRTVAALDASLDDLTFALSPALGSPVSGSGLRGGRFSLRGETITLRGFEFVPGVRITGTVGRAGARLRITGSSAADGTLRVAPGGTVRGRLGGRPVNTRMPTGPPRAFAVRARASAAGIVTLPR